MTLVGFSFMAHKFQSSQVEMIPLDQANWARIFQEKFRNNLRKISSILKQFIYLGTNPFNNKQFSGALVELINFFYVPK
jgi:hypothetical protein